LRSSPNLPPPAFPASWKLLIMLDFVIKPPIFMDFVAQAPAVVTFSLFFPAGIYFKLFSTGLFPLICRSSSRITPSTKVVQRLCLLQGPGISPQSFSSGVSPPPFTWFVLRFKVACFFCFFFPPYRPFCPPLSIPRVKSSVGCTFSLLGNLLFCYLPPIDDEIRFCPGLCRASFFSPFFFFFVSSLFFCFFFLRLLDILSLLATW